MITLTFVLGLLTLVIYINY